jgi:hypothetical protein
MKLTAEDTTNLLNILNTCGIGGVESIIIDSGKVRGVNESRSFVVLSDNNVPSLPQKVGLSRLSALKQRLEMFGDGALIEAVESDRGEISAFNISAGRNKVQFRCTATMLIKAPSAINDQTEFRVFLNKAEVMLLLNGIKTMGGKTVQLTIKADRSVLFVTQDATNDKFESVLETKAVCVGDSDDSYTVYYHADVFHSALNANRNSDLVEVLIGQAGTMVIPVNGHDTVVMPKVNEDGDEE